MRMQFKSKSRILTFLCIDVETVLLSYSDNVNSSEAITDIELTIGFHSGYKIILIYSNMTRALKVLHDIKRLVDMSSKDNQGYDEHPCDRILADP